MKSLEIYEAAKKMLVGGCSAGHRINHGMGRPFYMDHADGAHLYNYEGEEFIDYHCGAGAVLFGYNHPRIKEAIMKCIDKGFFMNYDSEETLEFARLFTKLVPTVEKLRLTNSGTEATMAAIRIARAYTGKDLIIKMDGHFHGMHEMIWFNGGFGTAVDENGQAPNITADVPGFPNGAEDHVKLIEFNNIDAVKYVFEKYRGDIAAIIMEPVNFDCGAVPSTKEYMEQIRALCDAEGILMIFDEVITGGRFAPGSAQGYYGVKPDISTFAKAIANGFSLAAVGGTAEVMDMFNPIGPVVVSGTSTGNLISVMAANECLRMMLEPGFFDRLHEKEQKICGGMDDLFRKHSLPGHVRSHGARFAMYFGYDDPEIDYRLSETAKYYNDDMYKEFVGKALAEKLYFFYPGKSVFPRHCGFNMAHTDEDIANTLERVDKIFKTMKQGA